MSAVKKQPEVGAESYGLFLDTNVDPTAGVYLSGWLAKKGIKLALWKQRYFVLTRSSFKYFQNKEKFSTAGACRGKIPLRSITAVTVMPDELCFEVRSVDRTRMLRATSSRECALWVTTLRRATYKAKTTDRYSDSLQQLLTPGHSTGIHSFHSLASREIEDRRDMDDEVASESGFKVQTRANSRVRSDSEDEEDLLDDIDGHGTTLTSSTIYLSTYARTTRTPPLLASRRLVR